MNSAQQLPLLEILPTKLAPDINGLNIDTIVGKNKIIDLSSERLLRAIEKEVMAMAKDLEGIKNIQNEQIEKIAEIKGDIKVINTKLDTITSDVSSIKGIIEKRKDNKLSWLKIIVGALIAALPALYLIFWG